MCGFASGFAARRGRRVHPELRWVAGCREKFRHPAPRCWRGADAIAHGRARIGLRDAGITIRSVSHQCQVIGNGSWSDTELRDHPGFVYSRSGTAV